MKHDSQKSMMFHLLSHINYNETLEDMEYSLGYTLGDYRFSNPKSYDKIREIAKQNWLSLNSFFNEENN